MNRWTSLIGAMLLILMLWTGGAAHAAEGFDCIPATSATVGHFEGDADQVPASREQGAAHHHSGCSGHQVAAPTASAALAITFRSRPVPAARQFGGVPGRGPPAALRPPIA